LKLSVDEAKEKLVFSKDKVVEVRVVIAIMQERHSHFFLSHRWNDPSWTRSDLLKKEHTLG
jgi:hypothetical protein